ncbi:MAG: acyl-CoA thioesterase [Bacteroidales bacterium]
MSINGYLRHSTKIQIRFNDLDILGHVNNAVYQHYYDYARMKYFKDVIGSNLNWKEFGVIMAGITINYLNPIKMEDPVSVRSSIKVLGDKSLTMVQDIINSQSHDVYSSSEATMVGFSAFHNETVKIPDNWKEKIASFEEKVQMKYPA